MPADPMSNLFDFNSPEQRRRDYIVDALREAGAMYEGDARRYLAEHDAVVRYEVLTKAADDAPLFVPPAAAHEVATWLRARADAGEKDSATTAPTSTPQPGACSHCCGTCCDPDEPGDYIPEVHRHDPNTRPPCPQCHGTGKQPAPPVLDLVDRQQRLLAVICKAPARTRWSTTPVEQIYRTWQVASPRSTGRSDLQDLCRLGHLTEHGPEDGRFYLLNTQIGGQS